MVNLPSQSGNDRGNDGQLPRLNSLLKHLNVYLLSSQVYVSYFYNTENLHQRILLTLNERHRYFIRVFRRLRMDILFDFRREDAEERLK